MKSEQCNYILTHIINAQEHKLSNYSKDHLVLRTTFIITSIQH